MPAGPLAYKSKHNIQPLSDLEPAIVLATVAGVTGWHHSITRHPGYAPKLPDYSGSAAGRTCPSAAGFHIAGFFFTNESGTYALSTRDATPEVPFNENEGFTEARLNSVLRKVRKLSDERPHIPREEPYLEGHNTWIANHPGSLLIAPVADLAQHTLANLAFFTRNKYVIHDDINVCEIPGITEFSAITRVDTPGPADREPRHSLRLRHPLRAFHRTDKAPGQLYLGCLRQIPRHHPHGLDHELPTSPTSRHRLLQRDLQPRRVPLTHAEHQKRWLQTSENRPAGTPRCGVPARTTSLRCFTFP